MKNEWNDWKYSIYRNAWRFTGPPHEEQKLDKEAYSNLLSMGGLLVRNTYDFDCQKETCFWYVIKDRFGGLEELPSRVRNKVRNAFDNFGYQHITYDTMVKKAYPIIEETYADYPVHDRKMNPEIFRHYLDECKETAFDFWGIFEKESGELVGFCTVRLWEKSCEYGVTGILSKYKKSGYYPYYGLYHYLNSYYLEKQGFDYVSDSARTITEHSQIQDFLIQNFNFRKAYCRLEIHYKWWMKVAVKVLYTFRKMIPLQRVKAILNMEAMQRGQQ